MAEKTVTVRNHDGIHCRPSSAIMNAAMEFPGTEFTVETDKGEAGLSSILSLLSLGLQRGDEVTVIATGGDEQNACENIAELFAFEFDFPPQ
ncbi:MAG: HPr family phosphocarrier protein [Victivallales bacterium]|nr:HPr family phosphocarrier protein [Victivallales bacterium]